MRLDPVGVVHPERAAVPPAAELAHDPEDRGLTAAADPERRHHHASSSASRESSNGEAGASGTTPSAKTRRASA